jgi:hypothetical protein
MSDKPSLINIGELSKPATALIEKVSDAVGGILKPWQIRRVAQAEAEADRIRAVSQIKITDLQNRALRRFLNEEVKKQNNIEAITIMAIPGLQPNAEPQKMDDDWISNFFDKCRLISDKEMQLLWAKILAGEVNEPGTFSKRTINFVSTLDKDDAVIFKSMCSFNWEMGDTVPIVFEVRDEIYLQNNLNFELIKHLDDIGLISFDSLGGYKILHISKKISVTYFGRTAFIEFKNDEGNELVMVHVLLSKVGLELARVCEAQPIPGFFEYVIEKWKKKPPVMSISESKG